MRKRWRYVGLFADEFFLCAARIQVGAFGQTFWCLVDREAPEGEGFHERSTRRLTGARGEVFTEGGSIGGDRSECLTRIESEALVGRLKFSDGGWVEHVSATDEGRYIWTRKRCGIPVEVDLRLENGRRIKTTARGIEDESLGYHPRDTTWMWSAGVGTSSDGQDVGWNLVTGINDPEQDSERAIWVDGKAHEPGPVQFNGLDGITFKDGSNLAFVPEAERAHSERFLIVSSSYRAPFGSFTGSLDGIVLDSALGVMEEHEAHW